MKISLKNRFLILTAAFVLVLSCAVSAKVPEHTEAFYVNDFAGVLDKSSEEEIIKKNAGLYSATGAQIVVVTTEFTNGKSIEDYCYDVFNAWEIGDKDKQNGLLLVLSIGGDDYYAMPGYGLENLLSADRIGDILYDYLEDDFADKNYDAGVRYVFNAFYDEISSLYSADNSSGQGANVILPGGNGDSYSSVDSNRYYSGSSYNVVSSGGIFSSMFTIFVIVVIIIVISSVFGAGRERRYYGGGMPYGRRYYRPWIFPTHHHHPHMHNNPPNVNPPRPNNRGGGFFGGFGGGGFSGGGGAGRGSFGSGSHGGGFGGGGSHSGGGGHTGGGGAGRR